MHKSSIVLASFFILIGCGPMSSNINPIDKYSPQQKKVARLNAVIQQNRSSAINDLTKKDNEKLYLDTVHALLVDSFKYLMPNFRVTVSDIDVVDFGNKKAFVAKFHDNDESEYRSVTNTEYWMEFDYPKDSVQALQNNPAYKLLKDMPDKSDTTLSFFYLGDAEIRSMNDQLRLRVIPFRKDYDFDSSQKVNKARK